MGAASTRGDTLADVFRRGVAGMVVAFTIGSTIVSSPRVLAQLSRPEYRVVFATPRELQRRVDEAGRDGYSCVAVARPEPDVAIPGVVVILRRPVSPSVPPVLHRVIPPRLRGPSIESQIDQSGLEGFRLCGIAFAEASPTPTLVAVMSRRAEANVESWRYTVQRTNRDGVAALMASAKEGFTPVFASPINDNPAPEMHSWSVVAEKSSAATMPIDLAIRWSPGPDGLQRAINEHSGYQVNLLWKEGHTIVAAMSRSAASPTVRPEYVVDTIDPSRLGSISGWYVGDVPYLSDGQRVVVRGRDISVSNAVVEDRLPLLGALDYADITAMRPLGERLSRHNYRITFASIRRSGRDGPMFLHTVLTRYAQ